MSTVSEESMVALCASETRKRIPFAFRGGFDTFERRCPEHAELVEAAKAWVGQFSEAPGTTGLLLSGPVGCGKSHLGCAILKALIDRHWFGVRYVNAAQRRAYLRSTWDNRSVSEQDIVNDIMGNAVIFLDDLGSESGKDSMREFTAERFYLLLDKIYREGAPALIVGTNLKLPTVADRLGPGTGERVVSRLRSLTEPLGRFPNEDFRKGR